MLDGQFRQDNLLVGVTGTALATSAAYAHDYFFLVLVVTRARGLVFQVEHPEFIYICTGVGHCNSKLFDETHSFQWFKSHGIHGYDARFASVQFNKFWMRCLRNTSLAPADVAVVR